MYSGQLSRRDRAAPVVAVVLIHLALGAMLLGMSGKLPPAALDIALKTFEVREPPPRPIPPAKSTPKPSPGKAEAPAPPAKKAEATPIVAPKPVVAVPAMPPVAAAPIPNQGTTPSQGASIAGPGTGAGGVGNGTGGGSGGDGGDGIATRPRPRFRALDPRGFPRALVEPLPNGARVLIIFTVQVSGRISDCSVRQSSGSDALDAMMCRVAYNRFRYDPARRGNGTPVAAKAAYMQVF